MLRRNANVVKVDIPVTGYLLITAEVDGEGRNVDSIEIMEMQFDVTTPGGQDGLVTPYLCHRPLCVAFKLEGPNFQMAVDDAILRRRGEMETEEA